MKRGRHIGREKKEMNRERTRSMEDNRTTQKMLNVCDKSNWKSFTWNEWTLQILPCHYCHRSSYRD